MFNLHEKAVRKEQKIRDICFAYGITSKEKQDEFMDALFKELGVIN